MPVYTDYWDDGVQKFQNIMVLHNRRFTTYQRTLAFLVDSSWPSQISIRGCVINKI